MCASLRSLTEETEASEGLALMLREYSQHAAIAGADVPERVQPRRVSRRRRRARG